MAAAEEEKETQPGEGEKPKEDKEAARKEKRERKKREKEEEKKRKEEEAAAAAAAKAKAKAAAKASVTSYSSDALLSLRAKCTSAPPEVDMEMFEHADKALAKREEERVKAEKAEKTNDEPRPSPPPSRSRSDDRLDEPAVGGALGLGFLGISSGSLASLDEGGGEKEKRGRGEEIQTAKKKAETKDATKTPMSVAELAKALLAELRGLEDRVEVAGDESGPMVLLKLGSALEAIRDEPFKSI